MSSAESATPTTDGRRTGTRDRLLEAALELFGEHGFDGASVSQIEGAVGLRPGGGGLYRHFASKEELLLEAVIAYQRRVRTLRDRLRAEFLARRRDRKPTDEQLVDDLAHLLNELAEFLAGEPAMVRLNAAGASLPASAGEAMAEAWDDGYGLVADLLVLDGMAPERSTALAITALGALLHHLSHLLTWGREPGGISFDDYLAAWIRQVLILRAAG